MLLLVDLIITTYNHVTEPSLLGAPVRRDCSSMKHGLDLRNQNSGQPPLLARIPTQLSSSSIQLPGGWKGEDANQAYQNNRPGPISSGLLSRTPTQVKGEEVYFRIYI